MMMTSWQRKPAEQEVHVYFSQLESRLSYDEQRQVAMDHPVIPVTGITLYLTLVIVGPWLMRNRQAFNVKWLLLTWNTALAAFSIVATFRYACILVHQYRSQDGRGFFCFNNNDNVSAFWYMLFVSSKFVEFGDTLFLVLRKRRIMFLHWYHHMTVLMMAWIVFVTKSSVGPFFGAVNLFIHSLMYTYYALQTIGVRIPRTFAMILTLMQMMQMVIGILVVAATHSYLSTGSGCATSHLVTISATLMYASYLLLFARFFHHSYIHPLLHAGRETRKQK